MNNELKLELKQRSIPGRIRYVNKHCALADQLSALELIAEDVEELMDALSMSLYNWEHGIRDDDRLMFYQNELRRAQGDNERIFKIRGRGGTKEKTDET